jgi:hypothetical protein
VSLFFKFVHLDDMKSEHRIAFILIAGVLLPGAACNSRNTLLKIRDAAADQPASLGGAGTGGGGSAGLAGTGGSGGTGTTGGSSGGVAGATGGSSAGGAGGLDTAGSGGRASAGTNGGVTSGSGVTTSSGGTTKTGGTGGDAIIASDGGVDVPATQDASLDVSRDQPATAADATVTCPDHIPQSSVYPYAAERCTLQAEIDGLQCGYNGPPPGLPGVSCTETYRCQCMSSQTPLVPPDCFWQSQSTVCPDGGTGGAGGGGAGGTGGTGGTDGGSSSADAGVCGGDYTACGCGCCGGVTPQQRCYYPALGETRDSIAAADLAAKAATNCSLVGCSLGTQYMCCVAAPPESSGTATYAATGTSSALDRIRIVKTDGSGMCTTLQLATMTTSDVLSHITLPAHWGVERASRAPCAAGTPVENAIGGIGSASFQSSLGVCVVDLNVTLFFGTTTLEAVPLDATGLATVGAVPSCI